MSPWSKRRKRIILSIVLSALVVLIGVPLFFLFYHSPTCFDGKQNGDETGVDCGGGCKKLCQASNLPIIIAGDPQIVQVSSSTYALYLGGQNPNVSADILSAEYTFKIYEASSSVPIKIISGSTYIPKNGKFAIFEGPISFGEGKPERAVFEWNPKSLLWNRNETSTPDLSIENKSISATSTTPRIEATLVNHSLNKVVNVELTAIVSDQNQNTVGISKTLVDEVDKNETAPVIFTWPAPFKNPPSTFEILIKILPR